MRNTKFILFFTLSLACISHTESKFSQNEKMPETLADVLVYVKESQESGNRKIAEAQKIENTLEARPREFQKNSENYPWSDRSYFLELNKLKTQHYYAYSASNQLTLCLELRSLLQKALVKALESHENILKYSCERETESVLLKQQNALKIALISDCEANYDKSIEKFCK
ncbi:hypothetical protein KBC04_02105 [Candidatus Babeliales bacterium]|nr:hypothetical protein [Candidatus Babeliales bacterium]MBP9843797.1 hypothetical protein [Candidatus Babeliales bacterium]